MTERWWRSIQAHVQTWRPYTLCYPALVGMAGAGVAGGANRPGALALAAGAPALGWLAGHYIGDYVDRDLDAIAKPQRPIPSGRLSGTAVLGTGVGCAVGSALLLAVANWRTLPLFILAMAGIVAYSRVCKRRGISGNLVRGGLTIVPLLVGVMVVQPYPTWRAIPFGVIFFLHDTSSNLVGAIRDVEGDRAGGHQSVPVYRGVRLAARLALGLYGGALAAGALSGLVPMPHRSAYVTLLVLSAVIGLTAFVPLLQQTPTQARALRAHEILVVERLLLAAAVFATGADLLLALGVFVPMMAFSALTQATMRSKYELPPQSTSYQEREACQ